MHSFRAFRPASAAVAVAIALTACGSDGPSKGGDNSNAAAISFSSGNNQVGVPGTPLASPLAAVVTNSQGNPVAGKTVTFTVVRGSGSVAAATVTTDNNGVAQTSWTLGNGAVRQNVKASVGTVNQLATATVDTTRSLFLMAEKDTVSVGDTIWIGVIAGTSGLGGETRGAINESIVTSIPAAATLTQPVYYYYANDYITYVRPNGGTVNFVTSGPSDSDARQKYLRVGYLAKSFGAAHDIQFTHAVTEFFGARTFNDLRDRVSVVGTLVHIR